MDQQLWQHVCWATAAGTQHSGWFLPLWSRRGYRLWTLHGPPWLHVPEQREADAVHEEGAIAHPWCISAFQSPPSWSLRGSGIRSSKGKVLHCASIVWTRVETNESSSVLGNLVSGVCITAVTILYNLWPIYSQPKQQHCTLTGRHYHYNVETDFVSSITEFWSSY